MQIILQDNGCRNYILCVLCADRENTQNKPTDSYINELKDFLIDSKLYLFTQHESRRIYFYFIGLGISPPIGD